MSMSVRPCADQGYRLVVGGAGAAVIVFGALVQVGWTFPAAGIESMSPGSSARNSMVTALAFLLAGIVLGLHALPRATRRRRVVGMACALGVLLIGVSRVWMDLSTGRSGADELVFPEAARGTFRFGPFSGLAPNTALALVCNGLALVLLEVRPSRRSVWLAQLFTLAAGLIALLALIGFGFNALSLQGVRPFVPMALNRAVALASLSLGILYVCPNQGLMAVVSSGGAGGAMARRLLPAAVLIPVAVGWVKWFGQREGVVDDVMGMALFILANILIFAVLIWWNAASLDRLDRERSRAERRLGVQHTATRVLAESPQLEDAVPGILQAICESLDWEIGIMWWVDVEQDRLRCLDLWHSPTSRINGFAALSRESTFPRGVGLPGRVWASGQPAWIPDVAVDTNFPRAAMALYEGLHGAFGLPILDGDDILGVVEAFSDEIQQPDEELLRLLGAIGSQVGQFMKRKQAEEVALQERFLLSSLMDTIPDPIYFKDAGGRFISINRAMANRFGLDSPAEAVGKTDFDYYGEEHARQAWDDEQSIMAAEQPLVGKEEHEHSRNGDELWLSTTKMPFRDKGGRIIGTFGVSRDITAWKEAEEALRQGEERFRSLIEATAAIVWNTPESGEFETEQPDWSAYTGQSFEQLKGWGWIDAVHPEDRPETARVWSAAVATHSLYQVEHRLRRYDGEYRHMLVRAVPIISRDGAIREWIGAHTDVDAEKRAQAAIREAEERSRQLLESSGEGIFGVDKQGRCIFINQAAANMLGYTQDELLQHISHDLIHHSHPDGTPYAVEDCPIYRSIHLEQGLRVDDEVLWRRDGSSFPVEYSAYPLRGADGKTNGAVVNFTDITQRKAVERKLVQATEAAQAATRAKSEFLANMSHEIRTPLNGIVGMTELVLDTELTHDQREYLGMVKLSADHLLNVINDILDFSKIEAGKLDLESIPFHLRDALDDTLATLAVRAHKKGLELADHVAAEVPEILVGDPHRLCQVVVNLIGNAIKFTERGEAVLRVEVKSRTAEEVWLHFAVSDTGIGIPQEQHQKLFKAFAQADTSTTRKYGGTGLGLAISARLVQLMGGEIWLESQAEQGSTFHFTMPFGLAHEEPPLLLAGPAQILGLSVLIVDDNATNRKILQEILTNWGMNPTVVDGGREAIEALERSRQGGTPYALVLLDAMMPEMDGFTLAEWIQKESGLVGATLMMLSSANRREDAARCQGLGIASYLTKPIRQSTLLDAIMTALGSKSTAPATGAPLPPIAVPTAPRTKLRLLLAEDNLINQRLAVALLKKRGHHVVVVGNGHEALAALDGPPFDAILMDVQMPGMDGFEATAAIRARDARNGVHTTIVAMTAHALKGDRDRCLAAGMDAYISKPIQSQELFEILDGVTPIPRPARVSKSAPPETFDMATALDRVEGDVSLIRELAGLFLDESPHRLEEIRDAITQRDVRRLQRAAHTLKGSVGNFGASRAFDATRRLEVLAVEPPRWDHVEEAWTTLEHAVGTLNVALGKLKQEEDG